MARIQPLTDPTHRWSVADSVELYSIEKWSSGYFAVNADGNLIVTPRGKDRGSADLKALVDELQKRGIQLPLLIRFSDILRSRIELLNNAFAQAISDMSYQGAYRGVYPIKVNQSRVVVEEIVEVGKQFHYGLEAGSKPELLAVMALHQDDKALVVCNGYKDEEYIRTALLASKLGPTVVLVAEKPTEIDHIHKVAGELGVKPTIGIRARLSARGSGKWQQSGGDRSKFGLSAAEMLEAVDKLRRWGELDCLKLLHFHLGSQISNIRSIKS
jgi:arginine decarboxylase